MPPTSVGTERIITFSPQIGSSSRSVRTTESNPFTPRDGGSKAVEHRGLAGLGAGRVVPRLLAPRLGFPCPASLKRDCRWSPKWNVELQSNGGVASYNTPRPENPGS